MKKTLSNTVPSRSANTASDDVLAQVGALLEDKQAYDALALLGRLKPASIWTTNAIGVCQLRLGNAQIAVDVFRGLVLAPGGIIVRDEAPTVFKTNYATALLANRNVHGCLSILA